MNTRNTTAEEHITADVARRARERPGSDPTNRPTNHPTPADHGDLRDDSPKTYYEDVVRIPGYRPPPDRCRQLTPVGFCTEGHTVLGRSSCGTRYCPDHWREWCEDAVVAMVARLAAYRHVQEGAEKRLSHVVASPPQDRRYSAREMWETRTEAYSALEAAGVDGGAAVVHPYRTNDRADRLFEAAVDTGAVEEDVGRWAFLRETAEDWDELAGYVEPSPHYHTLAAGADIDGSAAPEGWVVERVRSMDRFHYRDTQAYRSMVAPAYYVLTHAADQQGRQTTTYFGDVHPATFNPEEELTAAVWSRIQKEAEKAVKTRPGEHLFDVEEGPEECPCEACTAEVLDVAHLPDFLDDDEAVERVRSHRDGEARYRRLMGVLLWWDGRCDTPPPAARSSEARFREWLEDSGAVHIPEPRQVSLGTVMG